MNLTDEVLSAFLDGELPEADMAIVRDRLAQDPALAERLAQLAAVDNILADHYAAIDQRPLPQGVTDLLESGENTAGPTNAPPGQRDKVVAFPHWRRMRQGLQRRAGTAVAAALVVGFGLAQLWPGSAPDPADDWQRVAQALDTTPSGQTRALEAGGQLTPRLTFTNQAGDYCRQFRLQGPETETASEHIACRSSGASWVEHARVAVPAEAKDRYQTASGGSVLDEVLDRMMAGPLIEPAEERRLLAEDWRPQ